MGMAASQARFLNLTARRTNIEYQGQQINQQRTALSNASANLYNQMLTLQVPTPPNTADFTKVSYTFMMPGNVDEANVSQFVPELDAAGNATGKYSVQFTYKTVELGMPACTDEQKSRAGSNGTEDVAETYEKTDGTTATENYTYNKYAVTTASGKGYELKRVDFADTDEMKIHGDAINKLKEDLGIEDYAWEDDTATPAVTGDTNDERNDKTFYYINVGTEEAPKYQYYTGKELAVATAEGASTNAITYYTASDIETFKEDSYTGCTINRDVYNRVQSFTVTATNTTFAVTTKTVTDDDAYNDAMNEYTYLSYKYEQEMANINAKTSIIQVQDRELELKLKQLDTEHNAVQTEMETVKSVCKKNVEDSFKVFA